MEKDTKKEVEVKDTKKEEEEVNEDDNGDYYDDTDNYYIEKTLNKNIKDDPASVRSRPNPSVSKLQITDEDKIPKMPEKILPMPLTQEEYDKKKDEYFERIAKKKESIEKLFEQLREEITGIKNTKDSKNSENKKFNDLIEKRKKIREELKNEENKHAEIKKKYDELNAEVKKYEKMKFPTNLEAIQREIRQIQETLSYGTLTIGEEKKANEEKIHLEAYFKALKELRAFREENKEVFKKFSELKGKIKELNDALDPLFKKRKDEKEKRKQKEEEEKLLKKNADETNPVIGQIKTQIAKLKEEKKEIHKEFQDFTADQNLKWKEYNAQQNLIDYINRAKKKIKELKDRAKKQEKAAKAKAKTGEHVDGDFSTVIVKNKVHDKEIEVCDNLISYFGKINPEKEKESKKEEETKPTQQGEKSKLDEDLSKGFLKEFKRDEQPFGITQPYVKKKKGKKPKISKEHAGLVLDFEILKKLSSIQLSPPAKEEDIPKFLEELEKKKQFYLKDNVEAETPAKTESKK